MREQREQRISASVYSIDFVSSPKLVPGKIDLAMPSVSFDTLKLMIKPKGISNSFIYLISCDLLIG